MMAHLRVFISTPQFSGTTPLIAEIANTKYSEPLRILVGFREDHPREIEVDPGFCVIRVFSMWGEVPSQSVLAITDQHTDTVIRLNPWSEEASMLNPWSEEAGMLSLQESQRAEAIALRLRYLIARHFSALDRFIRGGRVAISSESTRGAYSMTANWSSTLTIPFDPLLETRMIEVGGEVDMSRIMLLPPDQQVTVRINRRLIFEQDAGVGDLSEYEAPADRVEVHGREQFRPAVSLRQYLRIGDMASAEAIARPLIQAQVHSFENWGYPQDLSSTLLCGYFSLRTGEFSRLDQWANLLTWLAGYSADAAVILGWHWLTSGETQDEEKAREFFPQIFSRFWLPVYTEGFKLLWDGLRVLQGHAPEGHERERLEDALREIGPYAANADWTMPFTTFYGNDPYAPIRGSRFLDSDNTLSIELTGGRSVE
jgi:hypothetical protein